jgi:non-ribosomal peptide synthetase component E (peptide arylation enzyme)
MAKVFNEIPSMPYEQLHVTVYNLRRDAARWKKTLDQIDPSTLSEKFLLDKRIRELLSDVKAALSDMDKSTAVIVHCPNVAETLATTFDLMRLREDLVQISQLIVEAHISPDQLKPLIAGSELTINSERWQQFVDDLAKEALLYRDGFESYSFHLSQTVDASLSK